MLDIFCNACNVCIWLGEIEPVNNLQGAHDPLDFISTIVNLKLLDSIVTSEDPDEETVASFVAFANLLRRPWFKRRWVIQEVSASSRASVQCGNRKINWIDFADAVQLFLTKLGHIKALYNSSKLSKHDPDALAHVESTGAGAIVRATDNVLRKTESGKIVARLWNIEYLVSTFVLYEASNPRDTIYALLPLACDGHLSASEITLRNPHPLDPDYSKSTINIYADFVRHCVESSGSLDIICRHWALPLKEERIKTLTPTSKLLFFYNDFPEPVMLPSWINLVTNSTFGPSIQLSGRLDGDSFVGEPGRKVYNASQSRPAKVYFGEFTVASGADQGIVAESHPQGWPKAATLSNFSNTNGGGCDEGWTSVQSRPSHSWENGSPYRLALSATGFRLALIEQVSPRTVDGIVSYDGLKMAGWVRKAGLHNIPDQLWRKLVADRRSDGSKAPSWWRRPCMYCLSKTSQDGDLNTSRLIDNNTFPETVLEYLRRVQAVVWNRKFFTCAKISSHEKSLLGLGPRRTQEGD
ncbi:MAG: hypothetical protein M1822_004012 [Bathelium mastoideum]|nr:MAG: hypothetical protein M1822_004012 [Bathelium mastoideum]